MLFVSSLTTADAIAVPSYVAVPRPNRKIVNKNVCYISVSSNCMWKITNWPMKY